MEQKKREQFDAIFHPRAIAVIGASRDERKTGNRCVRMLLHSGYPHPIYPINPDGGEIAGLKTYPSLSAVPGPVDYASVFVPKRQALDLLDECARKGVKGVHFFTAGFSEGGEEEGRKLEEALVARARSLGIFIIGPNCMGIASLPSGVSFMPWPPDGYTGKVSVLSQSGGNASTFIEAGLVRGVGLNKVVSFGNGSDQDSVDYLEYLSEDPETDIIGAYLEGVKDGRRLADVARRVWRRKPLVIWKGGQTPAGAESARSHTGSLAVPYDVWSAAMRQVGVVGAGNGEELIDILLALEHLPPFEGRRVGVVTGLVAGGGGASVAAADALVAEGLEVPPFGPQTRSQMEQLIPPEGSIFRNPLDLSQGRGERGVLHRALEVLRDDPEIDMILICTPLKMFIASFPGEAWSELYHEIVEFRQGCPKPMLVFSPPGPAQVDSQHMDRDFARHGVPAFPTLERAARALDHVERYWRRRRAEASD